MKTADLAVVKKSTWHCHCYGEEKCWWHW